MPLRFQDSRNCNVWTKGEVSMLRGTTYLNGAVGGSRVPVRSFTATDGVSQGVFYSNATGTVRKYMTDGTLSTLSGGDFSSALTVLDIETDGSYLYVMNYAGVYASLFGNSAGVISPVNSMTFSPSISRGMLRVVKDRLIIAGNASLYNAVPGSGIAMPAPFYTHSNSYWTWTGIASSGDAIFYAGYAGNQSTIFASVLETASAGAVPTVSIPFSVCELPAGEVINTMITYLNTYVVVGTSRGVRVGLIGNNGQIQMGPLSFDKQAQGFAPTQTRKARTR
jgi:hypothetical protein